MKERYKFFLKGVEIAFCLIFIVLAIFIVAFFSITGWATSGNVSLGVEESMRIMIHSPLNTTYNFNAGQEISLDLNVSSVLDVAEWRYSLYDLWHDTLVVGDVSFSPNTTFIGVRKGNRLVVQAREAEGNWMTKEVIFTVNVTNSAPILGYIDDSILVCEGNSLIYYFNASDADEDVLYSDISPKNPFYTITLGSTGNYSFFRIYSPTLYKNYVNEYRETISVNDFYSPSCCVDSKITNISVIEINNPPELIGIGAQTVWTRGDESNFYHQFETSDIEDGNSYDGNLRFNISFENNENLFLIDNYYGIVNYTPISSQVGVYSARVCVSDKPLSHAHKNISYCLPYGNWSESDCDNFTITVTNKNRAPQIINYTPVNTSFSVSSTDLTTFYVKTYDPDHTIPDINWYVDGKLKEHNEEEQEDNFTYMFGCNVSGRFIVKAVVTDGLINVTQEWNVSVNLISCPPVIKKTTGGGGGGGGYCNEKWVCDDWDVCQNLKKSFDIKALSDNDYYSSKEICGQERYSEDRCGFQIRKCVDLANCSNKIIRIPKPMEYQVCYYTENPSCDDGIKNCHDGGCELLVDCGGPCIICPTCSDGIQNQGEFGVDCGGPCPFLCEKEFPLGTNRILLILLVILILIVIFIVWQIRRIRERSSEKIFLNAKEQNEKKSREIKNGKRGKVNK